MLAVMMAPQVGLVQTLMQAFQEANPSSLRQEAGMGTAVRWDSGSQGRSGNLEEHELWQWGTSHQGLGPVIHKWFDVELIFQVPESKFSHL